MTRRRTKSTSNRDGICARNSATAINHLSEQPIVKIAVINFSGNVGKSTVARHLLAPRLSGAHVIAVESINSDDCDAGALRGSDFGELQDQLMTMDSAVVDVGASNVEDFVALMHSYAGSHEDFDCFIVPTVASAKQQVDTISTLRALSILGVNASKVRVVMNMVDRRDSLDRSFGTLFDFQARNNIFQLNRDAIIYENPIFERIKGLDRSILEIRDDPRDYVAMNAEAMQTGAPESERAHIRQMVALKRLAGRVTTELDSVFNILVH
jgi:hypothetical protein